MSQRLGDLLVKEKVITPEQLEHAVKTQKQNNCRLGSALVKLGYLTDEDVTNFLSRQYGVPAINLSYFEIDPSVVKLIPFETAKRYQILPLSRVGASLTIVKLVNLVLTDAVKRGASDIHMEPYEKEFRVRFRIDGVLQSIMSPPLKLKDAITSRVKILSKLDISEKRLPQDGRIMLKMNIGGRKKQLDFRVSTLPTLWG